MARFRISIGCGVLLKGLVLPPLHDPSPASARAAQPDSPAIQILTPGSGSTQTANDIELRFAVEDFTVDCAQSGRPPQPGVGHIHVMLDEADGPRT